MKIVSKLILEWFIIFLICYAALTIAEHFSESNRIIITVDKTGRVTSIENKTGFNVDLKGIHIK